MACHHGRFVLNFIFHFHSEKETNIDHLFYFCCFFWMICHSSYSWLLLAQWGRSFSTELLFRLGLDKGYSKFFCFYISQDILSCKIIGQWRYQMLQNHGRVSWKAFSRGFFFFFFSRGFFFFFLLFGFTGAILWAPLCELVLPYFIIS